MAVGSIERLAHTALAVGAGPSFAGTAGQSASRSRLPRAGSRTEPSSGNRATAAPDASSSGAIQAVQIVLLTALILVNVILVAIRDTVRRNNGA
jgi:hypothetical protein